ncbi:hypothetical protein ACFX14_022075 [Malus domestica]
MLYHAHGASPYVWMAIRLDMFQSSPNRTMTRVEPMLAMLCLLSTEGQGIAKQALRMGRSREFKEFPCLVRIEVGSKSPKGEFKISPSFSTSQFNDANSRAFPSLSIDFLGKPMTLSDHKGFENCKVRKPSNFSVHAQASVCVSRAMRWWEKTLHPNMVEIHSSQKLVDSLKNVGD